MSTLKLWIIRRCIGLITPDLVTFLKECFVILKEKAKATNNVYDDFLIEALEKVIIEVLKDD